MASLVLPASASQPVVLTSVISTEKVKEKWNHYLMNVSIFIHNAPFFC